MKSELTGTEHTSPQQQHTFGQYEDCYGYHYRNRVHVSKYRQYAGLYPTHKEAICNTCGVIWHPRNTNARRPARCPYCMSRKTEWLDQYKESHIDEEPVSESPPLSEDTSVILH